MFRWTAPAVFAAWTCFSVLYCPVLASDAERARFLAAAPDGWASIDAFYSRSRVILRETTTIGPRGGGDAETQIMHRRDELKFAGTNAVFIRHAEPDYPEPMPRNAVSGRNPEYVFELSREKDEMPWAITKLGRSPNRSPADDQTGGPSALTIATGVLDMRLRDLIAEPGFELLDVDAIQGADRDLVEIEFRREPLPNPARSVSGGKVVLDPKLNWAVVQFEVQIGRARPGNSVLEVINYRSDQSGLPIPLRSQLSFDRGADTRQTTVVDYETFEHIEIPEGEFRLAAFGLPEPHFEAASSGLWRWGVMLAGVVALLAAIALRRLVTRPDRPIGIKG